MRDAYSYPEKVRMRKQMAVATQVLQTVQQVQSAIEDPHAGLENRLAALIVTADEYKAALTSSAKKHADQDQYAADTRGMIPSDSHITDLLTQFYNAHRPKDGDPGKDATPEQITAALQELLEMDPPDYFENWVRIFTEQAYRDNPPKDGDDGKDATDEQVAEGAAAYLAAHTEQFRGPRGYPATDAQVADAAYAWLSSHAQDLRGAPGLNATDAMVKQQTDLWFSVAANRLTLKGDPGNNATAAMVKAQTDAWFAIAENRALLKGAKGDPGQAGKVKNGVLNTSATLIFNQTTDVVVPLNAGLTTAVDADAVVFGNLLGKCTATVKSFTKDNVTVTLKATQLISGLTGTVIATAIGS